MYTEYMTTNSFLDKDNNGIPDLIQKPIENHDSLYASISSLNFEMKFVWLALGVIAISNILMWVKVKSK